MVNSFPLDVVSAVSRGWATAAEAELAAHAMARAVAWNFMMKYATLQSDEILHKKLIYYSTAVEIKRRLLERKLDTCIYDSSPSVI